MLGRARLKSASSWPIRRHLRTQVREEEWKAWRGSSKVPQCTQGRKAGPQVGKPRLREETFASIAETRIAVFPGGPRGEERWFVT